MHGDIVRILEWFVCFCSSVESVLERDMHNNYN